MARTTLDIDAVVLDGARALARKRGATLGQTISSLLASELAKLRAGSITELRKEDADADHR
jgi:hypothetical protein